MNRVVKVAAVATVALFTLTACDPPIPQSLLVAQAEQQVACETGEASIFLSSGYADLGYAWAEMALSACPEMVITTVDSADGADLVASSDAPICEPLASAPLAFDSAAVVFYLDEAFSLNLSLDAIAGIFSGEITDWGDERIAADNPDVDLSGIPIIVVPQSSQAAIDSMQKWIAKANGSEVQLTSLTADPEAYWPDLLFSLEPGAVALAPMSDVLLNGLVPANVIGQAGEIIVPEQASFYAAASQFDFETTENLVVATKNFEKEPLPFPGTTEVALPYQAVFPVNLTICGEDTMLKRAVARYVVRLDAQGIVATSTVTSLPEEIRVASASVLGLGLPVPEIDPADLEG
jgi:phosphate transport system substrate-binding protein